MENVPATFQFGNHFLSKVRQYPVRFLPVPIQKQEAVIMIRALFQDN